MRLCSWPDLLTNAIGPVGVSRSLSFNSHRIAVLYSGAERYDVCTVPSCCPPKQVVLRSSNIADGCVLTYLHPRLHLVRTHQSYGYHDSSFVLRRSYDKTDPAR